MAIALAALLLRAILESTGADALAAAVRPTLWFIGALVLTPIVLSGILNRTVFRSRRRTFALWFVGRAGHRWHPMAAEDVAGHWEEMHQLPLGGQTLGGGVCRDCAIVRIDVATADGDRWMLLRQVPDGPWLHWVLGAFIARFVDDDTTSRWSFRTLVRAEDGRLGDTSPVASLRISNIIPEAAAWTYAAAPDGTMRRAIAGC